MTQHFMYIAMIDGSGFDSFVEEVRFDTFDEAKTLVEDYVSRNAYAIRIAERYWGVNLSMYIRGSNELSEHTLLENLGDELMKQ